MIKFKQDGFTLVEVLIAIVLLGFVTLYTYKMVDNATETKDQVLKEDQLIMQTLTALNRIDNDLSQIYTPLYSYNRTQPMQNADMQMQDSYTQTESSPTFDGRTKNGLLIPQFISEEKSSIQFLTTANRRKIANSKESRYAWIKYSLQPSTDEEELKRGGNDLVRQILPTNVYGKDVTGILKDPQAEQARAQVIMTNIKNIEFTFWDERSKKYVTSLQELNENKNLIRSIKMEMTWVDENNHEQIIRKTFRTLYPLFHTKQDDLNMSNAAGSGSPNMEDPNQGIVQ